mmetsp:Transcript_43537/g.70062  ORF Transcript_43537/g.70062 Transcript_43537/m.70062 type:complete len:197 (-) Transcript_43537:665-1255(-)
MAAERKRGLTQQEIDKMRAEKTAELMKQADLRSRKAEVTVKSRYASYVIGELDDNAICVVQVPLSIKPGMSFLVRVGDEEDLVSITPPPGTGPGTFLKFNLHETESAKDLDEIRIEKKMIEKEDREGGGADEGGVKVEGYLLKRGLINKAYKRRYFRLINGQLRYFALKSSPMNKIKGIIRLALHTFEKNVGEEYG